MKDEDIPKRLDTAADELIKLRAEVEQFQHGPPALAVIAQEAQSLIDKGDLDGANTPRAYPWPRGGAGAKERCEPRRGGIPRSGRACR